MKYELALVIKPLSNEDIKDKVMLKIEKFVSESKGSIKLKNSLGKRLLAYPIDNFKEGFYSFYEIEMLRSNVKDFKDKLEITTEILRYLFIDTKKL